MILIEHVALDKTKVEQTVSLKGVMAVLDITMIDKNTPALTIIRNTSENITRSIDISLLREGQNACCLLKKSLYKGSVKGYYLFLNEIRPKVR